MNFIQTTLQVVEVGKGRILIRIIPLAIAVFALAFFYNFGPIQTPIASIGGVYHGLSDAQSMDNAQLARRIARRQGFTTEFLRPQAVAQLRDFAAKEGSQTGRPRDLFPADQFPAGTPRVLPDTYNAPGYPYLLAVWFALIHPEFAEVGSAISAGHVYAGDRWIPPLNQGFMLLTALLVFALGRRLFDERVAWISLLAFLGTDLIWRYTLTGLSTSFLTFLVTGALICTLEIFSVGEACFTNEDRSFAPAWGWAGIVALMLAAACLTRLDLLVLLAPMFAALMLMPRASFFLSLVLALIVALLVTPWFVHLDAISGNPLGSNFPLVLAGQGQYAGNQIYCATSIPSYEQLFRDALEKEVLGFRWNFENVWTLLGSNPMILFFGASLLHQFKRRRTRLFHWLLVGCAVALLAGNNLGTASPAPVDPWNVLILLFPGMVVIGSAFFFILLDRLNLQIALLNNLIVTGMLGLITLPMVLTLTAPSKTNYAFPPYMPPLIKLFGQYAQPDEWVTSDMPWATAWYADRASLWLPDSISDFQNLYDNVCPTGVLLLTPVTWSAPISTVTTGEYKDWMPFVTQGLNVTSAGEAAQGLPLPPTFPLTVHLMTPPGSADYSIWSDKPRWQMR
jgi:4-amino-4-deoxy-L-arabinose transferase-like glycosyltransferase